jgi:hypothetical protein
MRTWPAALAAALVVQLIGARAAAQATVSGVVFDSLARAPLAGAIVQLVGTDSLAATARNAVSDSLGRYVIPQVPAGRYTIGFFHPMLDSLGLAPPLREVYVLGARPVRADIAIPAPARLRTALCGARGEPTTGALVVGIVRTAADRAPAEGVTVTADWLEVTFRADGITRHVPRVAFATSASGWFAICNAPSGGALSLVASRGADSTDRIEYEVPTTGYLRRDLYLGGGRGRVSGTVVSAEGGQPLAGAQVRIAGGPTTRANDRGEWTLTDAPNGTRLLEVRALTYYPERSAVQVIDDAPPIRVSMTTLKAVLDTVRVVADRLRGGDVAGFQQRRISGVGQYLTESDIARRNPLATSDLFRMIPGVRVEPDGFQHKIQLRGAFTPWCSPALYIDGQYTGGLAGGGLNSGTLSAEDVDAWLSPRRVAGIEIYTESTAPPQFHQGLSDCGSIVIWRKKE